MPKVSVIVPVYGVEDYIERCAISLFEQSLDDIEYVFVNDCTKDNSMEILKKVLQRYPHRRESTIITEMPVNSGLAKVRRYAASLVTGEYVLGVDSDDWVDTDICRLMYEQAVREKADVVVCDFVESDGNNVLKHQNGLLSIDKVRIIEDMLYQKVSWSHWNKMYRRDKYKVEYFPEGNMGEDMVMTIQMIYACDKISYLPEALYYYRLNNPSSIVHSDNPVQKESRFLGSLDNYYILQRFLVKCSVMKKYRRAIRWTKFSVKSPISTFRGHIITRWLSTFPFVEIPLLFDDNLDREQKKCLMSTIKNVYLSMFRK